MDDGDMIYEDPMERDMIDPSLYEAYDEEWINPFSTIIEDEISLDLANSCHMRMAHFDEKLEDLGPCISGDSSMISPSCLSSIKESSYIEDSFADIQHMMSLDYHS